MQAWIESGHLVEAIVAFAFAEWLVLAVLHRRTGRGPDPAHLGSHVLAGVFLLLALRAALLGSGWEWIAAALTAALVAHLADIGLWWLR